MNRTRAAALALAPLVAAWGCARAPRDPATECVKEAVAAAEKRDADGVLARVSERFRDAEGGGKADAAALVRQYLSAYESLSLTLSDVGVERTPAAGQARFKIRMSGTPRAVSGLEGFVPRASRWSFDVRLEAEPSGWKIVSAAWTRLEDAP